MKVFRLSNVTVPYDIRILVTFDFWLQKHHPEFVDALVEIDRRSRANPNGVFRAVARMIHLAYQCGALTQLAKRKTSLGARELRLRSKGGLFSKKGSGVSISREEEIEQERQEIRIEEAYLSD